MKDQSRFTAERGIASDVLLEASAIATPLLSTFSAWLMAGLGAALTLLVANLDSIAEYVWACNFRWALLWFSGSLLAGLAARFLSVVVSASLTSNAVFSDRLPKAIRSAPSFSLPAFKHFYFSGLLLPFKCVAKRTFTKAQRGDLMASHRLTAKASQLQAILVLVQIACSTASILILASGIKV